MRPCSLTVDMSSRISLSWQRRENKHDRRTSHKLVNDETQKKNRQGHAMQVRETSRREARVWDSTSKDKKTLP